MSLSNKNKENLQKLREATERYLKLLKLLTPYGVRNALTIDVEDIDKILSGLIEDCNRSEEKSDLEKSIREKKTRKLFSKNVAKAEIHKFLFGYNKARKEIYTTEMPRQAEEGNKSRIGEVVRMLYKYEVDKYYEYCKYIMEDRIDIANSAWGRKRKISARADDSRILGFMNEKRTLSFVGIQGAFDPSQIKQPTDHAPSKSNKRLSSAGFEYGDKDSIVVDGWIWKGYDADKGREDLDWLRENGLSTNWKENKDWQKLFIQKKSAKQRKLKKIYRKIEMGIDLQEADINFLWDNRTKMTQETNDFFKEFLHEKERKIEEMIHGD